MNILKDYIMDFSFATGLYMFLLPALEYWPVIMLSLSITWLWVCFEFHFPSNLRRVSFFNGFENIPWWKIIPFNCIVFGMVYMAFPLGILVVLFLSYMVYTTKPVVNWV